MKAIEFPEVNTRIAENQEEFETLPCCVLTDLTKTSTKVIICFELDDEEKKQVAETGQIWFSQFQSPSAPFHPIHTSFLKPNLDHEAMLKELQQEIDTLEKQREELVKEEAIKLEDVLTKQYGKKGTSKRDKFEAELEKQLSKLSKSKTNK